MLPSHSRPFRRCRNWVIVGDYLEVWVYLYTNGSGFYHFHPLSDWDIKNHWTIEFSGDSQVDYPLVASSVPTTSSIKLSLVSISWYLYHTAEVNIPSNGMWVVNMDFGTKSFRILRSLQCKRWRILTVLFDAQKRHLFDGFSTFVSKANGAKSCGKMLQRPCFSNNESVWCYI